MKEEGLDALRSDFRKLAMRYLHDGAGSAEQHGWLGLRKAGAVMTLKFDLKIGRFFVSGKTQTKGTNHVR